MKHIENHEHYLMKSLRNDKIDELRRNKREAMNTTPITPKTPEPRLSEDHIETELIIQNPENWLMFVEDSRLFDLLSLLSPDELLLLQQLFVHGHTQRELAGRYGITPAALHKRYKRIIIKLKKFAKRG